MKVLKFGGSVLKGVDDIKNIEKIVEKEYSKTDKIILIFSAFYGITNRLLEIGEIASRNEEFLQKLNDLKSFHNNIANNLELTKNDIEVIEKLFSKIDNVLKIIADREKLNSENKDYLLAFGERLSNFIISSFLSKKFSVKQISPCKIIETDSNFGYARVNFEASNKKIRECIKDIDEKVIVCAGFFGADVLEIWKDIDGLYTADPKIVDNVKIIKQITYQEMAELSSLGNKVIHINAISPCISANIPIFLKNCYNHDCEGTLICGEKYENYLINGIVKLDNVLILTFRLTELADITEFSIKLQKILKNYDDIVITVSQSFKQRKTSIMVCTSRLNDLLNDVNNVFDDVLSKDYISIEQTKSMSLITIIGSDLSSVIGISGKIFTVLEENNINIFAIQDDFSKTRISFLCDMEDANRAVKLLHNKLV